MLVPPGSRTAARGGRLWLVPLVAGVVAGAVYFSAPSVTVSRVAYLLIVCGSTISIATAARRLPPRQRTGWYLVAAGMALFAAAALIIAVAGWTLAPHRAALAVADLVYVAGYPVLFLGVLRLARARGRPIRGEDKLDAAIVAAAAFAVVYRFVLEGLLGDSELRLAAKIATIASPVMGGAILYVLVTSLVFARARRIADLLVAGAMVAMVTSNYAYSILAVRGTFTPGGAADAGWIVSSMLLPAAVLHRSAAESVPIGAPDRTVRPRRWLALIVAAGLVPPAVIVVETVGDSDTNLVVLSFVAAVTVVLLGVRGGWLLHAVTAQARELEHRAHTLEDVLARRDELEAEVRHRQLHDSLTGLPNRALFLNRIEFNLAAARRERRGVAVCLCDLDDFAQVNQALGPQVGDELLQSIARRIATSLGPGYTVARVGGDEFGVMVYATDHAASALVSADRIVAVLGEPFSVAGRSFTVSTCVGVALSAAGSTSDVGTLMANAGAALSAAKAAGHGNVRLFAGDMRARAVDRLALVSGLASALTEHQLRLRYQPAIDLRTGDLIGFEALVRWDHPDLGLLAPSRFIPLAEETGFIGALGAWVLWEACAEAARWQGPGDIDVSVNVSARQLSHPGLPDEIRSALSAARLDPRRLVIEVTETALMTGSDAADDVLRAVRETGVRVAVDDFGTGYSSLAQLRRLPVDILKIDKSFVDPLAVDGNEGAAFITTIVRLARDLGLRTVVEGIERPGQRDLLRDLGCEVGQGFLFAEPVEASCAREMIAVAHVPAVRQPLGWGRTPVSRVR